MSAMIVRAAILGVVGLSMVAASAGAQAPADPAALLGEYQKKPPELSALEARVQELTRQIEEFRRTQVAPRADAFAAARTTIAQARRRWEEADRKALEAQHRANLAKRGVDAQMKAQADAQLAAAQAEEKQADQQFVAAQAAAWEAATHLARLRQQHERLVIELQTLEDARAIVRAAAGDPSGFPPPPTPQAR